MKVVPELVKVVKAKNEERHRAQRQVGTIRVDIKHLEQKTFEATYKTEEQEYRFLIDEPGIRGGQGKGPTPLGYFLAGAAG